MTTAELARAGKSRAEMCRDLSCFLAQEAERFRDAGLREWSHRFTRDAELLRMRADREDAMEQTATLASRQGAAA